MRRWLRGARGGAGATECSGRWTAIVFVFLFAPIVTTVLYAFNQGVLGRQTATFTGFTTQWFSAAWNNTELRSAVSVSLRAADRRRADLDRDRHLDGDHARRHRGRVAARHA